MTDVFIAAIVILLLVLGVWALRSRRKARPPEPGAKPAAAPLAGDPQQTEAAFHGGAEVAAATRKRRKSGEAQSILIVDDQPAIRMLLAEVFQNAGFLVQEAASGNEAIERFTASPTDFLLLDLKMPDMDGIQALRQIRSVNQDVKAVMISAYSDPDKMDEARRLGVQRIFTKPFDIEKLCDYMVRLSEA